MDGRMGTAFVKKIFIFEKYWLDNFSREFYRILYMNDLVKEIFYYFIKTLLDYYTVIGWILNYLNARYYKVNLLQSLCNILKYKSLKWPLVNATYIDMCGITSKIQTNTCGRAEWAEEIIMMGYLWFYFIVRQLV